MAGAVSRRRPGRARTIRWPGPARWLWESYALRGALRALATIWFVTTLLFFLFRFMPTELPPPPGLPPLWRQYLDYLGRLARGDLGLSFQARTPVADIIKAFLPWTLFTVGTGLAISFTLGVALGTLMAYRRGGVLDHALTTFAAIMLGFPQFLLGILLLVYAGVRWQLFDVSRQRGALSPGVRPGLTWTFVADALAHAWLPMLAYVLTTIGPWLLLTKNAATATLEDDYVNQARARGLTERRILAAYVARNSLLPLVSYGAIALGNALGGSVIFEEIFVYRGLGNRLSEAILRRDFPVMQGVFLALTAAVVVANLLADLLYARLDPRVRVGEGGRGAGG